MIRSTDGSKEQITAGCKAGESIAPAYIPISEERLAIIKEYFPEAWTEGKVDWDKLREALGEAVDERPERYSFSWAGKRAAMQLLQTPAAGALAPCLEDSVNFDTTRNVFVEADNLEALKLLYKAYFGRVKMIYIDPPYNTGNDFIYPDNYADPLGTYLRLTGQADAAGNLLTSNPETSGRYHSAWLSMMYPRLFLARQLLREDGVIFVSVDDHEVHNLRMLMNEVFGEENRIECFVWKKSYGGGAKEKFAVTQHEYVLLYARNLVEVADLWLPPDPEAEGRYYKYRDSKVQDRGPYRVKPLEATKSMDKRQNLVFPIPLPWGGAVLPKRQWWWGRDRVMKALANDELIFTRDGESVSVSYKQYLRDENGQTRGAKPFSVIDGIYTQNGTADLMQLFDGPPVVQFPKPVALMRQLLSMSTEDESGDIVLDFFAGSCTTAQAVLELNREDGGNRRFIMVQLPEPTDRSDYPTIADIGKERIRRVIRRIQAEADGELPLGTRQSPEDLGFRVFKLKRSAFRAWAGVETETPESYVAQMIPYADQLGDGWTPTQVIWEIALREGFGPDARVERVSDLTENSVYKVADEEKEQSFLVCLDDHLMEAIVRMLPLKKEQAFICRDAALDDSMAANLALQCRLKTV